MAWSLLCGKILDYPVLFKPFGVLVPCTRTKYLPWSSPLETLQRPPRQNLKRRASHGPCRQGKQRCHAGRSRRRSGTAL